MLAVLFTAALVTAVIPLATAQEPDPPITFGPEDDETGLPEWVMSQGSVACTLTIPAGEDHGPYYELGGGDTQNGIEARYGAAIEGLLVEGIVDNGVGVRLRGLTPGETYHISEPHNALSGTFTAAAVEHRDEVVFADPQMGPVTDLTITTGTFTLRQGSATGPVLVEFALSHLCEPFEGDTTTPPPPGSGDGGAGEEWHPIQFGPADEENGGLPEWVRSMGSQACTLTIPAGEDHGAYYELGGGDTQNGIEARYGAGIEGLPTGDPPELPDPVVLNEVGVRLRGLTPGETYHISEPHGVLSGTFTAAGVEHRDGVLGDDPRDGPIVDLTITTGTFTLRQGGPTGPVLVEFALSHLCEPFEGELPPFPPPPTFDATFTPHDGNNWWVQTRVTTAATVVSVCASVDGGECRPLTLRSWGSWAASFFVPTGAHVVFTAVNDVNSTATSPTFLWPSGTIVDGPAPPPGAFAASFTPHDGNNWWVQTKVDANQPVTAVCASVDGGECRALTLRSWGSWAASFFVPTGAQVTFTATNASGVTVTSGAFLWPSGTPVGDAPPPGGFTATFAPHDGNNWWVQTKVSANQPVVSVCASVDGGECRALEKKAWGSWAASFFVPTGAQVTFTARNAAGESVTSPAFTWPVA